MLLSKRGAAILQVLLLAAVLAGVATVILRFSVARTASARQNRRLVTSQMAIESCMAVVNELWMAKSPEAFERDISQCIFSCRGGDGKSDPTKTCEGADRQTEYECKDHFTAQDRSYRVLAHIEKGESGNCEITYQIQDAGSL